MTSREESASFCGVFRSSLIPNDVTRLKSLCSFYLPGSIGEVSCLGPGVSFKVMREGETDLAGGYHQPQSSPLYRGVPGFRAHPRDEIMVETRDLKPSVA